MALVFKVIIVMLAAGFGWSAGCGGALDQAAPLADWKLPDAFATMRRLLEARMGKKDGLPPRKWRAFLIV